MVKAGLKHEVIDLEILAEDAAFWDVVASAFPAAVNDIREMIHESLSCGKGTVLRSTHGGRTVAMAATSHLPEFGGVFLSHIAVAPVDRGKGVGSSLLDYVRKTLGAAGKGVVCELDRADDAKHPEDTRARTRQLQFFKRQGGRVVNELYRQPALNGRTPTTMNLVFMPTASRHKHDPAFMKLLIKSIYFDRYEAVNGISRNHLEDLISGQTKVRPPYKIVIPDPLVGEALRRRRVDPLSETFYTVQKQLDGEVILRAGKDVEVWYLVDVPRKSYAIRIDGREYEFRSVLKAGELRTLLGTASRTA